MPSNSCEYQREYYLKNKEKLKERGTEKIECTHCGRSYPRQNLAAHNATAKHQRNAVNAEWVSYNMLYQALVAFVAAGSGATEPVGALTALTGGGKAAEAARLAANLALARANEAFNAVAR